MGVVHREYINSVWGRPYGTQVEPDFYGAICMVFALIFIVLYFSKAGALKKWCLAGALGSLIGLYFSFVRASWLVFLLVMLLLPFFRKKIPFFKFTWKAAALIIGIAVGIHLLAVNWIPTFRDIQQYRFSSKSPLQATGGNCFSSKAPMQAARGNGRLKLGPQLNGRNIRLFTMRISLRTWSEHPVIGHGPGSFAFVFWRYVYDEETARHRIADGYLPWTNPCMAFTVLGDTGLLGLFIFLAMAAKFIFLCRARLGASSAPPAAPALALAVGFVALLISYLLTNGLWLPMTWVFLALAVASLRHIPAAGGDGKADARGA
jgi:O-antigen ligase